MLSETGWEALAKAVTALSELAVAVVAIMGLSAWKRQLAGEKKYRTALRVLRGAYRARDTLLELRTPGFPREFALRLSTEKLSLTRAEAEEKHAKGSTQRLVEAMAANQTLDKLLGEARMVLGNDALREKLQPLRDEGWSIAVETLKRGRAQSTEKAGADPPAPSVDFELSESDEGAFRTKLERAITAAETHLRKYMH